MAETGKEARPPLLPAHAALDLDFDGTLASFAPDRCPGAGLHGLKLRRQPGATVRAGACVKVTRETLAAASRTGKS